MPFDRSRYPANWPEISLSIRQRDCNRCKWCGAANGQPHPDRDHHLLNAAATRRRRKIQAGQLELNLK